MKRKCNLLTFIHLGQKETPSFVIVEERSSNGAPSIVVTFPDGYQDALVLSKFYANRQTRIASKERCHYIGHLANELTACVAMTGCVGSQDVQFTILSKHPWNTLIILKNSYKNLQSMNTFMAFGRIFKPIIAMSL